MKNKEKYMKEIVDIACNAACMFGVKRSTGLPMDCSKLKCDECLFGTISSCHDGRKEWVDSEYVELPVISKRDRTFLDYIDSDLKYMVRDKSGILYAYEYIPHKFKNMWISDSGTINPFIRFCVQFPMIKWEDGKPWSIKDLKKLEVVEAY